VKDRRQDDAVAVVVEQRDGARLLAAHLPVGVVADHRVVGDRAVQAARGHGRRGVELSDASAKRLDAALEVTHVGEHVTRPGLPEHRALIAAHPAQPGHRVDRERQREERDPACDQRRRSRRGAEVGHRRKDREGTTAEAGAVRATRS
jgi:hypothetical protein